MLDVMLCFTENSVDVVDLDVLLMMLGLKKDMQHHEQHPSILG